MLFVPKSSNFHISQNEYRISYSCCYDFVIHAEFIDFTKSMTEERFAY